MGSHIPSGEIQVAGSPGPPNWYEIFSHLLATVFLRRVNICGVITVLMSLMLWNKTKEYLKFVSITDRIDFEIREPEVQKC